LTLNVDLDLGKVLKLGNHNELHEQTNQPTNHPRQLDFLHGDFIFDAVQLYAVKSLLVFRRYNTNIYKSRAVAGKPREAV